jgi:hypothetical protein
MIQSATERHSQPGAPRLWPSEPWPGLAASPLAAMPLVPSCACPLRIWQLTTTRSGSRRLALTSDLLPRRAARVFVTLGKRPQSQFSD